MKRVFYFLGVSALVIAAGVLPPIPIYKEEAVPEVSKEAKEAPITVEPMIPVPVEKEKRMPPLERFTPPEDRTVYLFGEVGPETNEVARQIAKLGRTKDPIYLIINSPGGSIMHGAQILAAIEASRGPITTVCVNVCASMAAMIFEYGKERWMMNKSILMFHAASTAERGELPKMISRLLSFQRMWSKIERVVASRLGVSYEQYELLALQELWIDSEDALQNKVADKVVFVDLPDEMAFVEPR